MHIDKLSQSNKRLIELIYIKCGDNEELANVKIEAGLLCSAISLGVSREDLEWTGSRPSSLLAVGLNPFDDQ